MMSLGPRICGISLPSHEKVKLGSSTNDGLPCDPTLIVQSKPTMGLWLTPSGTVVAIVRRYDFSPPVVGRHISDVSKSTKLAGFMLGILPRHLQASCEPKPNPQKWHRRRISAGARCHRRSESELSRCLPRTTVCSGVGGASGQPTEKNCISNHLVRRLEWCHGVRFQDRFAWVLRASRHDRR
jgi:hypothetical protein